MKESWFISLVLNIEEDKWKRVYVKLEILLNIFFGIEII